MVYNYLQSNIILRKVLMVKTAADLARFGTQMKRHSKINEQFITIYSLRCQLLSPVQNTNTIMLTVKKYI